MALRGRDTLPPAAVEDRTLTERSRAQTAPAPVPPDAVGLRNETIRRPQAPQPARPQPAPGTGEHTHRALGLQDGRWHGTSPGSRTRCAVRDGLCLLDFLVPSTTWGTEQTLFPNTHCPRAQAGPERTADRTGWLEGGPQESNAGLP